MSRKGISVFESTHSDFMNAANEAEQNQDTFVRQLLLDRKKLKELRKEK